MYSCARGSLPVAAGMSTRRRPMLPPVAARARVWNPPTLAAITTDTNTESIGREIRRERSRVSRRGHAPLDDGVCDRGGIDTCGHPSSDEDADRWVPRGGVVAGDARRRDGS